MSLPRVSRVVACIALAGLIAGAVYAKKEKGEIEGVATLDVDASGNLAGPGEGTGVIKGSLSSSGKFRGSLRGNAENLSGKSQTFKGDAAVNAHFQAEVLTGFPFPVTVSVKSSKYKVSKKGKASGNASGTFSLDEER